MKTPSKPPLPSKQYSRDANWIARNYAKLARRYANRWVAVHKSRVVAVGDDSGEVKAEAQARTGFLDIPVQLMDDATVIY